MTDKVPKAITQKALMQELWFLNSACHLILVDICMKIQLEGFSSCRTDTIETQFGDGQSSLGNNSKSIMQELWFLHSACPLMLVNICMKFHNASLYDLKVIERTRWRQDFVRDKVQREITKKKKKQELPFLHSARHLMLIDICMTFREDSLRGFQVTKRKQFVTDRQTDGRPGKTMSPNPEGGRHKNTQSRVMVLIHDTSSYCALQLYEV